MVELNGEGTLYQYTEDALENGPSGTGTGTSDWSTAEKQQIRSALGIDGDKTSATNGQLQTIDLVVDSILEDTGTTIPALIAALNDVSLTDINAEVVDALNVDTYAEPGQGNPSSTASLVYKIGLLYKLATNMKDTDGSTENLYDSSGTTVDQKCTVSDDGTTATKTAWITGA